MGGIIYLFLFAIIIIRFMAQKGGSKKGTGNAGNTGRTASRRPSANRPLASDGHRVPSDQDISCRRFGHKHEEFETPRFIPHSDPEEGYIILNGIKMKRGDADRYEERI
ncbi:hypothetical protein SAMN04487833_13022 [Sarcina sp. DSM 11001]|uniref:hypothetical protein n=1 Tax=Sarcina sp. DSM 11001 TaxID=1798184 RepID=UPI000880C4ED|nr:hypothetical protein [Sarcina sp. DSM 11001]SDL75344.1 hypothetical protein SAMN04487833_13022 [Sarcina sp. DSM 11001]